jgi:hypothetical protein
MKYRITAAFAARAWVEGRGGGNFARLTALKRYSSHCDTSLAPRYKHMFEIDLLRLTVNRIDFYKLAEKFFPAKTILSSLRMC